MANLSKSFAPFAFTSPRTIEKIIPEIALLTTEFLGQEWNSNTQEEFFNQLFDSDFYEGEKRPSNPALAGRDRITRAPKALGFVQLKPTIQLTPAGERLMSGVRIHETFTRQLVKFQLPSPYHTAEATGRFGVKPYLELLRLTSELDGLAKWEIAVFFSQLTHWNRFEEIKTKILDFRAELRATKTKRKAQIEAKFESELGVVYAQLIAQGRTQTRQSADDSTKNFIRTQKNNRRDYADAFMRYLRATQLVTFDARSGRLAVSAFRRDEVDFLLDQVPREPASFSSPAHFEAFLFDPDTLPLLTDDPKRLAAHITGLEAKVPASARRDTTALALEPLKDYLAELEEVIRAQNLATTTQKLKTYDEWPDIMKVFGKISNKELPDPSLYLEWNIWRALTMLNYAQKVQGNFYFDLDGAPLSTAGAKQPDIECDYDDFRLERVRDSVERGNQLATDWKRALAPLSYQERG